VFHIGISAEEVPNPAAKKIKVKKGDKKAAAEAKKAKTAEWRDGVTGVKVVEEANPPMPVLNKPVVLNEGGFVDAPLGQEKSFLQKYWWAIAIFVVINLAAASGPDEGSK